MKKTKLMNKVFVTEYLNPMTDLYEAIEAIPPGKDFKKTIKDLCSYYNENMNVENHLKQLEQQGVNEKTGAIIVMSMCFMDNFGPYFDIKNNEQAVQEIEAFEKNNYRAYRDDEAPKWNKKCLNLLNKYKEKVR